MIKTGVNTGLLEAALLLASVANAHEAYILPLIDLPEGKQVLLHAG